MEIFKITTLYFIILSFVFVTGSFFTYKLFQKYQFFEKGDLARMRNYKYFKKKNYLKILFLFLALSFLFISILRPVWGVKQKTIETTGTDVVFALDVSKSMKAMDIDDKTDRLSMAKEMINSFVSLHQGNQYGLIIFAGESFVSTPLTSDTSAFLTFLLGVDSKDVSVQGTNLEAVLQSSIDRFYSEQDKKRGRAVVIISDGGEDMNSDISKFAKVAKDLNIKIFTIGIGNKKGVPIPEARDVFGRTSYKKYQGKTVLTKLNEGPLKKIAKETNGEYYHVKNKNDLEKISNELKKMQISSIKTEEKIGREDYYQYFLFVSFLFFILFLFFDSLQQVFVSLVSLKKYIKLFIFLLLLPSLTACTNNDFIFNYHNSKGIKNYQQKYYKEAKTEYKEAEDSSKDSKYIALNNLALVNYRENDYEVSKKKLEQAVFVDCEKKIKENCDEIYYNLANIYYKLGEKGDEKKKTDYWQKAIQSYKKDLAINANDKKAQENIDFILDKLKKEQDSKQANNGEKQIVKEKDKLQSAEKSQTEDKSQKEDAQSEKQEEVQANNKDNKKTGETDVKKNEQEANKNSSGAEKGDESEEFDKQTEKEIDNYMKALEKQEKSSQDYFQPNPNGNYNNSNPFDNFFDNQFFDNFFDNRSFNGSFNNQNNSNEVDW